MCAHLDAGGAVARWSRFTPPGVRLPRPSGLCFDGAGDLWVTAMPLRSTSAGVGAAGGAGSAVAAATAAAAELVLVAGPERARPGEALRRLSAAGWHPRCAPAALPFDVAVLPPGAVEAAEGALQGDRGGSDNSSGDQGSGEVLAVSMHAGNAPGSVGAVALVRARDGGLVRRVEGALLGKSEPNMMAVQRWW